MTSQVIGVGAAASPRFRLPIPGWSRDESSQNTRSAGGLWRGNRLKRAETVGVEPSTAASYVAGAARPAGPDRNESASKRGQRRPFENIRGEETSSMGR